MINIFALIPIYNRVDVTKKGIESILNSIEKVNNDLKVKFNFQIVIIDDNSPDDSYNYIKKNYPFINLIKTKGNLWWTGCINEGINYCKKFNTDYFLLLNDDNIISKDYFQNLFSFILTNHNIKYLLGSKICFEKDRTIWSIGGKFNRFFGTKFLIRNSNVDNKLIDCDWLPGMGTLIPSNILYEKKIQFDFKTFPHYYGDSDFCLRCKKNNIEVKVNTDLIIYNQTELTGDKDQISINQFLNSLISIKSFYEIKRNLFFYTRHGVVPIVYFGMLKKYIIYFISKIILQ